MHLRLHCIIHFVIAAVLASAVAFMARAQETNAPPQSTQAPSTATIHGHITDQTGALIPGAKITITDEAGNTIRTLTADAGGAYETRAIAAGNYIVKAESAGFAPFQSQPITLAAGQAKRVDIAMAIQVEQQNVVVTDETPTVNVEASGNSNAIVLKGKDLDALSDDPDELANELSALAGPSAGPNGGQIFIDGFSGGQLPPKSAIREIRINQNPFSAEFDRLGYGRIEILTKPGTDKLHGQFFGMGNDKSFNTSNPFTKTVPSYYSYHFNGTLSGAINRNTSFFVTGERRHIGNIDAWLIPDAILPDASGLYSDTPNYGVNLLNVRIRTNISARIDRQIGAKNTITARYGFWSESEQGDLNAGSLPSASWHESNTDHTLQMSEAWVINDRAVTETRFQYERQNENHYPDSNAPTVNIIGDMSGGGLSTQVYRDHATRLEFQSLTTISRGPHAIKFGTRLRDTRDANFTTSNFNGNFRFSAPQAYLNMQNGLATGQTFNQLVAQGNGPETLSFTSGPPSVIANQFDAALFFQDDWKVNQRFTLSGGLRWESQNHVADHNDWAPRLGLAYALDGAKGKPAKTVIRAGFGIFYDRFTAGNLRTVYDAGFQNKIVLNNPVCSDTSANSLNTLDLSTCSSGPGAFSNGAVPVRYRIDPSYHSPYTNQLGIGLERQLNKGSSLTLTYLHSFGPHQLVTINANQFDPLTGDYPLDSSGGYIYQFYPEAVFKQDQLITSVNARVTKNLSLVGFYTLGFANSNGGAGSNASNANNLSQDYGPATFNARNQIFSMANYQGPWGLRFNPFLIAQSGKPFNVTLAQDPLNDFYNQRPGEAALADCQADPSRYISTRFGCLDSQPAPGEALVPANMGTGPAAVAINLRISRGWGFGPETGGSAGAQDGGHWDGGGGGRRGGPPGGSLGPGGLGGNRGGGGMFGGGGSTGRKYSLTFSVQALNLFNNIDYGGPNGVLGTRRFDRSTTLAGGIFSTGSAARRIFAQAIFSF